MAIAGGPGFAGPVGIYSAAGGAANSIPPGFNITPLIPIWNKTFPTLLNNTSLRVNMNSNISSTSFNKSNNIEETSSEAKSKKSKGLFSQSGESSNGTGVLSFLLNNPVYKPYK